MAWNPRKSNNSGSSWSDSDQGRGSSLSPGPVRANVFTNDDFKPIQAEVKTAADFKPIQAQTACYDSSTCASGWACVGGFCVDNTGSPAGGSALTTSASPGFQSAYPGYQPPNGQSSGGSVVPNSGGNSNVPVGARYPRNTGSGRGSGSTSGCGNNFYNDPDGNRVSTPCEPNPADNGCRKSGCGPDRLNASDCCGEERCCRYSANGFGVTVNCNCGPCPDPSNECNSFCSNFRAANGQLSPGCDDQSICDECSDCISTPGGPPGTSCQPKVIGQAPCQCDESSCSLACDRCDPDGICRVDCDNCVVPFPTYARCSCGDFRTTSYVNACGARWADPVDCSALCGEKDEPDECAGTCTSVSWCDDQPTPPCPAGSSCSSNGSISAGGKTCYIRTDCDKTNVPPECEECDCNCNDDCPDCEICNSSGVCVDDPACKDYYAGIIVFIYEVASSPQTLPCSGDTETVQRLVGRFEGNYANDNDPGPGVVWITVGTVTPGSPCANITCTPAGGCIPNGSYVREFPRRANGSPVTDAKERFEGNYSESRTIGFDRTVYTFYSGATVTLLGYGDSPSEAQADVNAQLSQLQGA